MDELLMDELFMDELFMDELLMDEHVHGRTCSWMSMISIDFEG